MKHLLGKRLWFTALRGKISVARGTHSDKMVCITDLVYEGQVVKDHAWITWDKRTSKIKMGEEFRFEATVKQYISLDENFEQVTKYSLSKIRSVEKV